MKTSLFNNPETIYLGYEDFFKEEFVKPFGESEHLEEFPQLLDPNLKLEKVTLYQDPNGESGFHKFSFTIPHKKYRLGLKHSLTEFLYLHLESELENPVVSLPKIIINETVHIDILIGFSA